jgi:membrane associated rhomboid family serine protease
LTLIPIFIFPLIVRLPAVLYLGLWFGSQILSGALTHDTASLAGGVAFWAHIGGFTSGMCLYRFFLRDEDDETHHDPLTAEEPETPVDRAA